MKIHQFEEPLLEFGGARHIDIRYGISNYGPFDVSQAKRPACINTGVIGTPQTITELREWIDKCRQEVVPEGGKPATRRDPVFPGFSEDSPFKSAAVHDDSLCAAIRPAEFHKLAGIKSRNQRVEKATEIFVNHIEQLKGKGAHVILCTLPIELLALFVEEATKPADVIEDVLIAESESEEEPEEDHWNFHDLLKARSMRHGTAIQLIRPSTWNRSYISKEPDRVALKRQLQDEPLRAWNFFAALYYKAGGCPWRLPRTESALDTCYVGVSFYRTLDQTRYRTSLAQVFNERGTGVVVRGGEVRISQADNQPHLEKEAAEQLLTKALQTYRDEHHHHPAQVVVYKTTRFNQDEMDGFTAALSLAEIDFSRFLSISRSWLRLYRDGYFPPLRGTCLELDETRFALYTKGSVPFYEMYPGPYIPRTLLVRKEVADASITELSSEILALTKMNWNNTQLDGFEPLPTRAAREVGSILKYCRDSDPIASFYRHYM
jgi:hypothetical protein